MAQTKRTSFVFYDGFYEAIQELETAEEKVELLDAICTYEFTGVIPEMSYACRVAFKVIKKSLDTATTRYVASVENGKKGGRPKKTETQQNLGEPNITQQNLDEPTKTQDNHNDNVNVNANENENANANNSTTKVVASPSKRLSRKEQLVNYVNELDYSEETKKALFSWIFQIGLNGNCTVQQLQDKLQAIWKVYDDESLVRQSIEEAYRNNWFGFFPLKNKATKSPATLEKKEPSSFTNIHQDNNYSEEIQRPARQKQMGCWNITY